MRKSIWLTDIRRRERWRPLVVLLCALSVGYGCAPGDNIEQQQEADVTDGNTYPSMNSGLDFFTGYSELWDSVQGNCVEPGPSLTKDQLLDDDYMPPAAMVNKQLAVTGIASTLAVQQLTSQTDYDRALDWRASASLGVGGMWGQVDAGVMASGATTSGFHSDSTYQSVVAQKDFTVQVTNANQFRIKTQYLRPLYKALWAADNNGSHKAAVIAFMSACGRYVTVGMTFRARLMALYELQKSSATDSQQLAASVNASFRSGGVAAPAANVQANVQGGLQTFVNSSQVQGRLGVKVEVQGFNWPQGGTNPLASFLSFQPTAINSAYDAMNTAVTGAIQALTGQAPPAPDQAGPNNQAIASWARPAGLVVAAAKVLSWNNGWMPTDVSPTTSVSVPSRFQSINDNLASSHRNYATSSNAYRNLGTIKQEIATWKTCLSHSPVDCSAGNFVGRPTPGSTWADLRTANSAADQAFMGYTVDPNNTTTLMNCRNQGTNLNITTCPSTNGDGNSTAMGPVALPYSLIRQYQEQWRILPFAADPFAWVPQGGGVWRAWKLDPSTIAGTTYTGTSTAVGACSAAGYRLPFKSEVDRFNIYGTTDNKPYLDPNDDTTCRGAHAIPNGEVNTTFAYYGTAVGQCAWSAQRPAQFMTPYCVNAGGPFGNYVLLQY